MSIKAIFAALALSLPSCTAANIDESEDAPDTNSHPDAAETPDGAANGQISATIETATQSDAHDTDSHTRDMFELTICINIAPDKVTTKEAFCRSLQTNEKRGACWRHRFDNSVAWINWCVTQF